MFNTAHLSSRRWSVVLTFALTILALSLTGSLAAPAASTEWIVELGTSRDNLSVADVRQGVFQWYKNRGLSNPETKANLISIGSSFNALTMPAAGGAAEIASLANVANVRSVSPTVLWKTFGSQAEAPEGLDRIDGDLDGEFNFPDNAQGAGVDVFVIDTGVDINHEDFGGRAQTQDFTETGERDDDGHGSHVAGTIAGSISGIAKEANVFGLKVFDASGTGSNAVVLKALEEASRQVQQRGNPAVVNMSLGGARSGSDAAFQRAVESLVQQGVAVVVAAGNESQDACDVSPAFIPSAITVASSDPRNDELASDSNVGSCVNLIGPGVQIPSVEANSEDGIVRLSGTSMASPHVAGVMAALMSTGLSADAARQQMLETAEEGAISGNLRGTPNVFLRLDQGSGKSSRAGNGNGGAKKAPGAGKQAVQQPGARQDGPTKEVKVAVAGSRQAVGRANNRVTRMTPKG